MKSMSPRLRYALDVLTSRCGQCHYSRSMPLRVSPLRVSPLRVSPLRVSPHRTFSTTPHDDSVGAPFAFDEGEDYERREEAVLDTCEAWVHNIYGTKQSVTSLNPALFGLPPRVDVLVPIVLRQLKYKLQEEPYGSEENNFIDFDRFTDPLYKDRPYLKPWVKQGLAWSPQSYTLPTQITSDSTRHLPVPHYNGSVPLRLREAGVRVLLSLKYRYDNLHVVDTLSSGDRPVEPSEFRTLLDDKGFTSVLMITGDQICPYYKSEFWKRKEPFPVMNPGVQRLWKTATYTTGCELREVAGLDVWSGLLYATLILDMSAIRKLERSIITQPLSTGNMNLRTTIANARSAGTLGVAKRRVKAVRVVNIDNL